MKYIYFTIFLICSQLIYAVEPTIVAEPSVSYSAINQSELISIFTRKKIFWPDGHRISVFIKPQTSVEHKMFAISVLNLSPFRYKTLLDSVIYSGANNPAIELQSDEEMIIRISSTPYSIGYLNYTIVVNNNTNNLIKIDVQ